MSKDAVGYWSRGSSSVRAPESMWWSTWALGRLHVVVSTGSSQDECIGTLGVARESLQVVAKLLQERNGQDPNPVSYPNVRPLTGANALIEGRSTRSDQGSTLLHGYSWRQILQLAHEESRRCHVLASTHSASPLFEKCRAVPVRPARG